MSGPETNFIHGFLLPQLQTLSPQLKRVEDPAVVNTERITAAIERAATQAGARSEREVYAGRLPPRQGRRKQPGRLDCMVRERDGTTYAIEIDRENKLWSVDKLRHVADSVGWIPVWVRWREQIKVELPRDVLVIDMCHWEVQVFPAQDD